MHQSLLPIASCDFVAHQMRPSGLTMLIDRSCLPLALRWCRPLGFVAIIAGLTTTEVGRQPWVAQGVLRTADAASPIPAMRIAMFVALFVLVYGVVFGAGIRYIRRLIKKGLEAKPAEESEILANRPISAASKKAGQQGRWPSCCNGRSDPMESYLAMGWGQA
jgi:cytochrome bd-type quinol oxidase subunit 1